jgi:3-hydroxyisobutyrate dehydrogenase
MEVTEAVDDSEAVVADIWRHLRRGLKDRHSAFHTPTLVTTHNGLPEPRTVVLRLADAEPRIIGCHTRADAGKIGQIQSQPRVAWHVYDKAAKLQIVCHGTARVSLDDELAEDRWSRTSHGSRACYRRIPTPGQEVDNWLADEAGDGRDRFAVIVSEVNRIDWLYLHHSGHHRWTFDFSGGTWSATRRAP